MHRITDRTYVGVPNETATLSTQVGAGGQVSVTLDGTTLPANGAFTLPATPGTPSVLQIALVGPLGATCAVGIATVDGGTDGDFLMCQVHSPAPVHFYTFSCAARAGVAAFAAIKSRKRTSKSRKKRNK